MVTHQSSHQVKFACVIDDISMSVTGWLASTSSVLRWCAAKDFCTLQLPTFLLERPGALEGSDVPFLDSHGTFCCGFLSAPIGAPTRTPPAILACATDQRAASERTCDNTCRSCTHKMVMHRALLHNSRSVHIHQILPKQDTSRRRTMHSSATRRAKLRTI